MVTCTECNKTFRKESGLRWHLERIHRQAQQPAVFHQPSEQQVSERQPVSLLEGRLRRRLKRTTGVLPEPSEVEATLNKLWDTEPESLADKLAAVSRRLGDLNEQVHQLQTTQASLSEQRGEYVTAGQLSELAEAVNKNAETANKNCEYFEERVKKLEQIGSENAPKLGKLHICPDCGRSLHMHRLDSSWHLECLHCGYYSVNYKYPAWKKTGAELFASKQGAKG